MKGQAQALMDCVADLVAHGGLQSAIDLLQVRAPNLELLDTPSLDSVSRRGACGPPMTCRRPVAVLKCSSICR